MTAPSVSPGCVFHWKDYKFDDGETANKYLVFVGAKSGCNYLAVVATSRPHKRSFTAGCHADAGYYHIPGGKEGFKKDTWLLIAEPQEMTPAKFLSSGLKKEIELECQLRGDIANAICNCMKRCPDVSAAHVELLGPPVSATQK
jgi:hypothetical protein